MSRREEVLSGLKLMPSGCWEWQRGKTSAGYGLTGIANGKREYIHRFMFSEFVDVLDNKLVIDHTCGNRACGAPYHLRQITRGANVLAGNTGSGNNSRKTSCIRDHELVGSNLRVDNRGHRQCRKCDNIRQKEYRAKQ